MIGLIDLSLIGILFLGGLIALIIQTIPQLRIFGFHPLLAFIEGIAIAYILDDFSMSNLTYGDIVATVSFIVFLLIYLIPIIRDWVKSRNEKLKKVEDHLQQIDIKIANINGKIEALLHMTEQIKKKK